MPVRHDYFRTTISFYRLAHKFVKQVFDLPQRKRKPNIQHHRQADNLGRCLEISKWIAHPETLRKPTRLLNPDSPDTAPKILPRQ
jgi:hypothetical protein